MASILMLYTIIHLSITSNQPGERQRDKAFDCTSCLYELTYRTNGDAIEID